MAFTSRAKRQTGLNNGSTPNNVGPASYYPSMAGTQEQIRGRAPFSSTAERQLSAGQPQWVTPGPGSYIEQSRDQRKAAASSNVFVNKVERFSEKTEETPGPGAYTAPERWIKQGSGARPTAADEGNSNVVWFRNPSAPSIPTHGQSFGYEQGNDGRLVRQLAPPGGYTGGASDSVGPGDYNPPAKGLGDKGTTWHKSRVKREFVKESNTPGPGHYSKPITGLQGESMGDIDEMKEMGTSQFVSKVSRGLGGTKKKDKNATPGPGAYVAKSSFQVREVPENLQFFGSTSRRSFEVEPSQYGADFSWKTPGPGSYEERRSGFQKGGRTGKLADKAAPAAPFDSLQPRFRGSGTFGPGPGQYDEDGKSLVTQLARKTRARNGVFGTTANRFFGSQLYQAQATGGKQPGPGHYDVAASGVTGAGSKATGRRRRPKKSSVFASGTQRFNSSAPAALGPAPGDYDVVPKWPGQEPARLTLLERDVFIASADRFPAREIVPGSTNNLTPGPGAYEAKPVYSIDPRHMGIAALEGRSTIGTAKRFGAEAPAKESLAVPGPGAYNSTDPGHSMVKRSYNITVDV